MPRRAPLTEEARQRRNAQARASRQAKRRHGREYTGRGSLPLLVESLGPEDRLQFVLSVHLSTRAQEDVTRALQAAGHRDVKIITSSRASDRTIDIGNRLLKDVSKRPLKHVKPAAIIIDATPVGNQADGMHTIAWALGVGMDGAKFPLTIVQAPTEGEQVFTDLLQNLHDRGLNVADSLWVTDGGRTTVLPAIRKFLSHQRVTLQRAGGEQVVAVDEDRLNVRGVMQRCVVHKARNVIEHNLLVSDRVEIGRRLVKQHLSAVARGEARTEAHKLWRVAKDQLELLRDAQDGQELTADDELDTPKANKVLRQVAERVIRRQLYAAWNQPELGPAEAGLRDVSRWLKEWGYDKSAESVLEGIDEQLTLQRLGVRDSAVRRFLRTTNAIESPHAGVTPMEKRNKHWQHDTQRLRVVTMSLANLERGWTPLAERAQLEELSLRVMAQRHPKVELEVVPGEQAHILRLASVTCEEDRVEKIDAAFGDLLRWADDNDKTIVVPNDVAVGLPSPNAQQRWLQAQGFTAHIEHRGALVRTPRSLVTGSPAREADGIGQPGRPRGAGAALSEMRQATGGNRRLLNGIAESALRMAPEMLNQPVQVIEREAAPLDVACRELASLKEEVQAWWKANWRAAVDEVALDGLHALRERRERPHPLRGGRHLVLEARQAEWLLGAASAREEWLKQAPESEVAAIGQRAGAPLASLDPLAARVEQAARVVAAAHTLDFHRQIAVAQERAVAGTAVEAAGTQPPTLRTEGALSQIERRRGALRRHTDTLSRFSQAMAPFLQKLPDRALHDMHAELGDPWRHLNPRDALLAHTLEEKDRNGLLAEREEALREVARRSRDDEQRSRWPKRRNSPSETTSRFKETADQLWDKLRKVEKEAEALAKREDSLDRFLVEHPEVALHDAVDTEVDRRFRERGIDQLAPSDPPDPQVQLEPALGVDIGVGG